jgi:hypothetical protein
MLSSFPHFPPPPPVALFPLLVGFFKPIDMLPETVKRLGVRERQILFFTEKPAAAQVSGNFARTSSVFPSSPFLLLPLAGDKFNQFSQQAGIKDTAALPILAHDP